MTFPGMSATFAARALAGGCCAAALLVFFACSDDEPTAPSAGIPAVTTAEIGAITGSTAQGGGTVTDENGAAVTARGVCWSTDPAPTIHDARTSDGAGKGDFASTITGLISGSTYHVRGYATSSGGTGYGVDVPFTTGAYVDEGSEGSPVDISEMLPYAGQVAVGGTSYYRVTGVTGDAVHTIALVRTDGLTYLLVPDAVGNGGVGCGWDDETPGATVTCTMRATAAGVLDFAIVGDETVGGAYLLSTAPGGIVNEGRPDDPVVITSYPFDGGALVQSYYLLTGLVAGGAYAVEFTAADGPIALFIYPDATYQREPNDCLSVYGRDGSCNVVANAAGYIYLMTNIQSEACGVSYSISVTATGLANEGSYTAPVDIGALLPYAGMVHTGNSWYIITGLAAGEPYTVTLANATDNVMMRVYGPGWWVAGGPCEDSYYYWANGGGNPVACVSLADLYGGIRVVVHGLDTADGATYDLDIAAGGLPNEGYWLAPVDLTGAMPWSGTIYNGPSRYVITGLAPATDYTVTITNATGDLTLWVYDDGAYQNQLCYSNELGTADETCLVQTATGELHLRVTAAFETLGATFSLEVAP